MTASSWRRFSSAVLNAVISGSAMSSSALDSSPAADLADEALEVFRSLKPGVGKGLWAAYSERCEEEDMERVKPLEGKMLSEEE